MCKFSFVPVAAVLLTLAAGPSARADYSNTVASFGPLAYWRLNETTSPPAADAAANIGSFGASGNGFYVGNASHPVTGALAGDADTAASFDGTSGQVNVPYFSGLSIGSPFTAEAWFNPATAQTGGNLVCAMAMGHFASPRAGWLIYQSATGWNLRFYNQNGTATSFDITGGTAPVPGTWYHVAVVYNGTSASIYVNGVATTGTPTGFVANPDSPLTIGSRSDNSFYYNGSVDEVALYTNALSAGDILAHYQNGTNASRVTPYNVLVAASNPVVYHRLNEPAYTPPAPETLPIAVNSGSVGAAANGTYQPGMQAGVNGVPYSGFGVNNKASRFNGVAGHIDMGVAEDLNLVGHITVIAWMKSNPAGSRFQAILGKGDASWRMSLDDIGLGRFADGNSPDATGARNINDGQWHQMAGVYDGATLSLYVDGKLDGTVTATGTITGSGSSAMIGTVPDYVTSRIFQGSVDEVAVFGTALSSADVLQIYNSANVPATIVQQPASPGAVFEGATVALTVDAVGTPTLAYQWTKNSAPLAGQTTSSLTLNNIQPSQGGNYAVIVTNNYGAVTSSVVAITVQSGPPIILAQPQSLSRYAGGSASFTVSAGGTAPLSYQWMLNGSTVIANATASSYTINNVQLVNQGNYSCTVSNSFGATNTTAATLTVVPAPAGGYATTILADAPLGYWRLGETSGTAARDYVGGHDGIYTNVVLGLPGYSAIDTNKAAGFGPADDSYVGEIQGINFAAAGTTATFTLEAWVKGPTGQSGDVGIIAKGAGAGGEQFDLDTGSGGNYRFLVRDAGGGVALCNSSVAPSNAWQHVVAVCNAPAGQLLLYVDGQQVASATAPANGILNTTHAVSIGSRQSASGAYDFNFEGSIDEVAIYGTALSAAQVQAHYDARYGNSTPAVIATQPSGVTNYATLQAIFSVDSGGTPPLSYQWKFNGVDIVDATSSRLVVSLLDATNAGNYTVVINNAFGSTNSAAASLAVLPAPTVVDLSSGLVMHLKFDGNLTDATGRGNNGTNVGSTTFVDGKIGSGSLHYATIAGSSYNYVTLGVRPDLQFGSNVNFSVAYWVRQPPLFVQGDLPFLCNASGSTYSFGYVIAPSYQTGSWGWSLYDNSDGVGVNGEPGLIASDGGWHHLTHTFDRNGLGKTYLDGNLVDSRPISSVGDVNTGLPTNIGQDPNGTYGETGEADLDDMGIWHRVLTPLEVGAMFVGGNVNGITFAAPPTNLAVQLVGGQVRVTWSNGVLQSADNVTGPFNDVSGATSPYVTNPTAAKKFYRIKL